MRQFSDLMKQGLAALFYLGIFAYLIILLGTYVRGWSWSHELFAKARPIYAIGLPACGITAFAVVCILELPPSNSGTSDKLEFKAFGLTFSGPAASVTLWIVCYLTLVASIYLMDSDKKKEPNKAPVSTTMSTTSPAAEAPRRP